MRVLSFDISKQCIFENQLTILLNQQNKQHKMKGYQWSLMKMPQNWDLIHKAGGLGPAKGPASFGVSRSSEVNSKHFRAPFTISKNIQDTSGFPLHFVNFPWHFVNFQDILLIFITFPVLELFYPDLITLPNIYGCVETLWYTIHVHGTARDESVQFRMLISIQTNTQAAIGTSSIRQ